MLLQKSKAQLTDVALHHERAYITDLNSRTSWTVDLNRFLKGCRSRGAFVEADGEDARATHLCEQG